MGAHMCCLVLANGSYGQGEGTNGGRLRVFSSAQAPWRVALKDHQILESGIWDSIVRYKSERGVLDKSKISRGGSLFLIIFKLWYKRTPLTGKPRHERPPLPPQICLG